MTKQVGDIVPRLEKMSRDDLLAKIAEIRGDRKISKHAKTDRIAKQVRKKNSVQKMLEGLSDTDRAALLAMLEE